MLAGRGFYNPPLTKDQKRRIAQSHEITGEIKLSPVCIGCDGTGLLKPGMGHGYCRCQKGQQLASISDGGHGI